MPSCAVESEPGDVVFFDQNLFHASFGGRSGRRMFTLCYCTVPRSDDAVALMRDSYDGSGRAVTALGYGGAEGADWPGVHHPEVMGAEDPALRRLTEPLARLGFA